MKKLKRCENGRISAITLITQHPSLWSESGLKHTENRKAESIKVEEGKGLKGMLESLNAHIQVGGRK